MNISFQISADCCHVYIDGKHAPELCDLTFDGATARVRWNFANKFTCVKSKKTKTKNAKGK